MDSKQIRKEFLYFFKKRGHTIVPSSSILPSDTTVLFTTAGMQQFKLYYLGEKSPYGPNVVSCQKCFRTSDIEEVGDASHLTFLEMLGNFSFGGYFKETAIKLAYEFLFQVLKLPKKEAIFTVFEGDSFIPVDNDSILIWKSLGIPENKIKKSSRKDNFWGPTGKEGPCGPTTEIHFRGVEVWNLVFNEYYQDEKGELTHLKQKGVDTGMGLERLTMIIQNKSSVFETDLFQPLMEVIKSSKLKAQNSRLIERSERIIADHMKSSVFLIAEGVLPSNVEQGYVLRRILRRIIRYGKLINFTNLIPLAKKVIEIYQDIYPEVRSRETDILTVIQNEKEKFEKTLARGLKEFEKIARKASTSNLELPGERIFDLYQSYGFPLELTEELAKEKNLKIDKEGFFEFQKKHREISRAGAEKKFGGVGKEADYKSAKLHTATHLLHAALRQILGSKVKQMGSDINPERLRFDFSYPRKMTPEEIREVEDLVNEKIKEDLIVRKEEMDFEIALKSGALAFFKEKYPQRVSVYTIGTFSKEICAGPHVERTAELNSFKIIKEEACQAGVRRIKARLEEK